MSAQSNIFTRALQFYGDVKQEGRKVTWPTRRETIMTAAMVFVLAIIAAIFFAVVDQSIYRILKYIIN